MCATYLPSYSQRGFRVISQPCPSIWTPPSQQISKPLLRMAVSRPPDINFCLCFCLFLTISHVFRRHPHQFQSPFSLDIEIDVGTERLWQSLHHTKTDGEDWRLLSIQMLLGSDFQFISKATMRPSGFLPRPQVLQLQFHPLIA